MFDGVPKSVWPAFSHRVLALGIGLVGEFGPGTVAGVEKRIAALPVLVESVSVGDIDRHLKCGEEPQRRVSHGRRYRMVLARGGIPV